MKIRERYAQNKSDAVYHETMPSLADQAGADETNINVIMRKYGQTGMLPGHNKQPIDMDFSLLPSDLRTMIETTREMGEMWNRLPGELREIPWEQLQHMTTEQITAKLTPPATPPDDKGEQK